MTQVIAVSKAGINVLTANNPNDFIFHSSYNTFKIKAEGTLLSQSVTGEPTTFSIAHGQSVTPGVFAFAKFPDGIIALPNEVDYSFTSGRYWNVRIDANYIHFLFYKGSSDNYSVDIKYYIFEISIN